MRERIGKILADCDKQDEWPKLARRLDRYVQPLYDLFPPSAERDAWLDGLACLYAFCLYEDKIADGQTTDKTDAMAALRFLTLYLQWAQSVGAECVKLFVDSLEEFAIYTRAERGDSEDFTYTPQNYLVKEAPIAAHLQGMERILGSAYAHKMDFVRAYCTQILLADDVEDFEDDVRCGHNTLVTAHFARAGFCLRDIRIESSAYWQEIERWHAPLLRADLERFSAFRASAMYADMESILRNIYAKTGSDS